MYRTFCLIVIFIALANISLAAPKKTHRKPATTKPAVTGTLITQDTLPSVLSDLGFQPKTLSNGALQIETESGEYSVFVVVNMSKSNQKIWFTTNLGSLSDTDMADSAKLLAFLQKNNEIQPFQFFLRNRNLRLGSAIDNRAVTTAMLQKQIDTLADLVIQTRELWMPKEAGATPTKKAADRSDSKGDAASGLGNG